MADWEGWNKYIGKPFYEFPDVVIQKVVNTQTAICRVGEDLFHIMRLDGDYYDLLRNLYKSADSSILKVLQVSIKNKYTGSFFAVMEKCDETLDTWMTKHSPLLKSPLPKNSLDEEFFLYPFRSLIDSAIKLRQISRFEDFTILDSNVFVVKRKNGEIRFIVGLLKSQKRQRNCLQCLDDIASIVTKWFVRYECDIPSGLRDLIRVMQSSNVDQYGSFALKMLTKFPIFYRKRMKSLFEFIIIFMNLYKGIYKKGTKVKHINVFCELGYENYGERTEWYKPDLAIQAITNFVGMGLKNKNIPKISNNIDRLLADMRNLATHIPKHFSEEDNECWVECYENIEKMLPGTFSSIILLCIKLELSHYFF